VVKRARTLLLTLALCLPAPAADYLFRVNDLAAELTVRADGKVELRYAITFTPEPGSHPVDIVDIGMPNEDYELSSARAAIAGARIDDIRRSEYVKPGVEVHLGANAIPPGESGTLEFSVLLTRMVFADSADGRLASLQFKTTWYDRKFVAGTAEAIEIRINLPPGSAPDGVKYHDFGAAGYKPSDMRLEGDRVVYVWQWRDQPATMPYAAGASFPRDLVTAVAEKPKFSLLGSLLSVVFALIAFVFSLTPLWIIVLIIILAVRSGRRRLQRYLPPRVGIESGGIKRGLAPPEAALLQELPLAKVLLLVIFGLLKKGRLEVRAAAAGDTRFHPVAAAADAEPREYETAFLAAIDAENRLDKERLKAMFTAMIAALEKKMAGFSRRETNAYYQSIMNKAWEQVRSCPRETLPKELEQSLEWLVLDPQYEEKLEPFLRDTVFLPGRGGPWYQRFPQGAPGRGNASVPGGGFGQGVKGAAANLVGSLQAFSGALLGDGVAFTQAVTRVSNPPPAPTYRSSGRSGGGSGHSCACACACACAGCACACAGGGR
jgi:hypothetical protein